MTRLVGFWEEINILCNTSYVDTVKGHGLVRSGLKGFFGTRQGFFRVSNYNDQGLFQNVKLFVMYNILT